jgi:hypothetical protein
MIHTPTCAKCGRTFEAIRSDARFCNAACRRAALRDVDAAVAALGAAALAALPDLIESALAPVTTSEEPSV